MNTGGYRQALEAYMRLRNDDLPPEKQLDPGFLDKLFDLGTPVFSTVAKNFDELRRPAAKPEQVAEFRADPVPWLAPPIDRESRGSAPWLVLEYLRKVQDQFRYVEPLGYRDKLPIREVYVPMTTAPPKNTRREAIAAETEGRTVAFREMFAHLVEREYPERHAVLVVGEPGSGKTTAARQLAWLLACRFRVAGLPEDCIPVWLPFRAWE